MNFEINQSKLEVLIRQRMVNGRFQTIEDALVHALESSQPPGAPDHPPRTGADLIVVMQSMPYRDEIEFDHARPHMPARDAEF